ncbi:CUB and LDLa domain isoform X2 [Lycorma delicatula]|uniref:CUB and LDLa domain isoform X2 n=1 Tax=Lycorma delicatula TaxID=130591 RepID=UPI003F517B89
MKIFCFARLWIILIIICIKICIGGITLRQDDICGIHNGRRLYLELGERGILTAKNVTTTPVRSNHALSHDQCNVEIVTCPSCVIVVNFRHIALPAQCGGGGLMDGTCRCDYLWLSEPPYDETSGAPFCGLFPSPTIPPSYRSQTRTLVFTLLYSQHHRHAFTLEYSAERNREFIKGSPSSNMNGGNVSHGGSFSSPFFPSQYPRDYGIEYVITCEADSSMNCRVRIIFSDFQLADTSVMEFYDSTGLRLDVVSGAQFRPPVILSTGSSVLIRFYANGGSGIGYKAVYSFITGSFEEKSIKPITDCGGYVGNLGGAITMMNMVERSKGETIKSYDCVWLIRPPGNFYHLKTHLYLKVETFLDMAGNTELIVRQGQTSEGPLLETVRHPMAQFAGSRPRTHIREHVIPLSTGYYVSLRGTFNVASRLAIVYSAFTYMDCFTGSDFLCQNHRCVPAVLTCDGFDHCGDSSDEPETCTREWEAQPVDRRWYSHTPNYYFPKMERYPDLKTATLVFIVSSIGLVMLITALVILLYRMGARARQQRELQSRLQTISELLDGARIEEVVAPPDEPPDYEAPPDYEEIIKSATGSTQPKRKKRPRRSRSSPGPRTLLTPGNSSVIHTSHNQPDDAESLHFRSLSPQLGSSVNRSCQVTPVPDSPPPPYSEAYSKLVQDEQEIEAWVAMNNNIADLSVVITSPSPISSEAPSTSLQRLTPIPSCSSTSSALFDEFNKDERNILQVIPLERNSNNNFINDHDNEMNAGENNEAVEPLVHEKTDNSNNINKNHNNEERHNTEFDVNILSTFRNTEPFGPTRRFNRGRNHFNNNRNRNVYSLDVDHLRRKHRRMGCNCEGACGCVVSSSSRSSVRSITPESWSPPSYSLQALDIYFSNLEFGSRRGLRQHSKLKIWKSPESSCLSLSIGSVDNLRDLV